MSLIGFSVRAKRAAARASTGSDFLAAKESARGSFAVALRIAAGEVQHKRRQKRKRWRLAYGGRAKSGADCRHTARRRRDGRRAEVNRAMAQPDDAFESLAEERA